MKDVKTFDRKPSMLFTVIVFCIDDFEQNARMLVRCSSLISNTRIIGRHPPTDQHDFNGARNLIKMFSVMLFAFDTVEFYVVTINKKLWTRAREVCKTLRYEKAARRVVRHHCAREHIQHKHQLVAVATVDTAIN